MDSQSASLSLLLPAPNIFRVRKQNWLLKVTWMNINSWKCHVAPGIIPNKPRLIWKNFFVKKKKEQKKKHKHWSLSKAVKSTGRLISEGLGSGPLVAMIRRMVWYNKSFLDSCLKDASKVWWEEKERNSLQLHSSEISFHFPNSLLFMDCLILLWL